MSRKKEMAVKIMQRDSLWLRNENNLKGSRIRRQGGAFLMWSNGPIVERCAFQVVHFRKHTRFPAALGGPKDQLILTSKSRMPTLIALYFVI